MIAGHRIGHYSAEGKLLTPLSKKQIKAVEKTLRGKVKNRLSLSTCKSRTLRGIRTFPPPLRLLTYETGHFTCSQKRTFSLANDTDEVAHHPPATRSMSDSACSRQLRATSRLRRAQLRDRDLCGLAFGQLDPHNHRTARHPWRLVLDLIIQSTSSQSSSRSSSCTARRLFL